LQTKVALDALFLKCKTSGKGGPGCANNLASARRRIAGGMTMATKKGKKPLKKSKKLEETKPLTVHGFMAKR